MGSIKGVEGVGNREGGGPHPAAVERLTTWATRGGGPR